MLQSFTNQINTVIIFPMRLCVFQGTFNPIHNGHLMMADFVLENFGFEKILFIPAFSPPHKDTDTNLAYHRLEMVKLAIEDNPNFEISDIEYKLKKKSYTYFTIKELYKMYEIEGKINFIIGTDAFETLDSWYEIEKLRQLIDFIVFVRENNFDENKYKNMQEKGYHFRFAKMNFNDISSTDLRDRIKENLSLEGLIPLKVEGYIEENELYKD